MGGVRMDGKVGAVLVVVLLVLLVLLVLNAFAVRDTSDMLLSFC